MMHKFIFAIFSILVAVTAVAVFACTRSTASQSNNAITANATPKPAATAPKADQNAETSSADDVFDGKEIVKANEEWKKQLSAEAYYVLREEGTERAFTGAYDKNKSEGDYHCAACHLKLFSSKTKFDSGTGWPSFYEPVNKKNVVEKAEKGIGDDRIEVECARCGSHLGHVFDDGPKPTGLRYCMNSVSLNFEKKR